MAEVGDQVDQENQEGHHPPVRRRPPLLPPQACAWSCSRSTASSCDGDWDVGDWACMGTGTVAVVGRWSASPK